jgi:Ribosomal L32p protein family
VDSLDACNNGRVNRSIVCTLDRLACKSRLLVGVPTLLERAAASSVSLSSSCPLLYYANTYQFLANLPQYLLRSLPHLYPPYSEPHGQYNCFLLSATSSHHSSSLYPKRKSLILEKPCAAQTRVSKISKVSNILPERIYVTLNNRADLVHCPGCGSAKLAHHLCPLCYSSINRAWKVKSRNDGLTSPSEVPS